MTDLRKAAEMALEALEWRFSNADAAIEALRQAIEQEEKQEPVAWMSQGGDVSRSKKHFEEMGFNFLIPLYNAPPKSEWVGLDENDFEYQPPQTVLTMKFAEAILRDRNK
jgi:hypothetical protein